MAIWTYSKDLDHRQSNNVSSKAPYHQILCFARQTLNVIHLDCCLRRLLSLNAVALILVIIARMKTDWQAGAAATDGSWLT